MDSKKTVKYVVKTDGNSKLHPLKLNIDGSEDQFYRYKVRQLFAQVVGKGKMIKTVLLNVDEVARDLQIPPSYLVAYVGYELGAAYKYEPKKPDREKASVAGDRTSDELNVTITKFIQEIILCPKCKLPETKMIVGKEIEVNCRSCGQTSTLNNLNDRFRTYILNHPVEVSFSKGELAVRKKQEETTRATEVTTAPVQKKSTKKGAQDKEEGEIKWSVDVSENAVKARRNQMMPNSLKLFGEEAQADPCQELKRFIEANPKGNIASEVRRIQKESNLQQSKLAALLFEVFFPDEDKFPSAKPYKKTFLELINDDEAARGVLDCIEKIGKDSRFTKKTPILVKEFYDFEILSEEQIKDWYLNLKKKSIKEAMQPLITWFDEAEEEEEE